jgi:hypothetical protein
MKYAFLIGLSGLTWISLATPAKAVEEANKSTALTSSYHNSLPNVVQNPFPDGLLFAIPKSVPVYPVNLEVPGCVGKYACHLHIDKLGNPELSISSPLKELDSKSSTRLFGAVRGPEFEKETPFWTYHVSALHATGPNIYHIDVELADTEGHWKRYRVRGYQITNSNWQTVQ